MKSKTAVLTAAAGRKLLRRIRSLEDEIHALAAKYEAGITVLGVVAERIKSEEE